MKVMGKLSGYRSPRIHPVMRDQFRSLAEASSGGREKAFRTLAGSGGPLVARALAKQLRAAGTIGALLADTVTPTQVSAGYKHNVVPGDAQGALDCRLLPDTDPAQFVATAAKTAAKYGVTVDTIGLNGSPVSERGRFYEIAQEVSRTLASNMVVVPSLTPGTTDVRAFRKRGPPATAGCLWCLLPSCSRRSTVTTSAPEVKGFERAVELMTEAVLRACS